MVVGVVRTDTRGNRRPVHLLDLVLSAVLQERVADRSVEAFELID